MVSQFAECGLENNQKEWNPQSSTLLRGLSVLTWAGVPCDCSCRRTVWGHAGSQLHRAEATAQTHSQGRWQTGLCPFSTSTQIQAVPASLLSLRYGHFWAFWGPFSYKEVPCWPISTACPLLGITLWKQCSRWLWSLLPGMEQWVSLPSALHFLIWLSVHLKHGLVTQNVNTKYSFINAAKDWHVLSFPPWSLEVCFYFLLSHYIPHTVVISLLQPLILSYFSTAHFFTGGYCSERLHRPQGSQSLIHSFYVQNYCPQIHAFFHLYISKCVKKAKSTTWSFFKYRNTDITLSRKG